LITKFVVLNTAMPSVASIAMDNRLIHRDTFRAAAVHVKWSLYCTGSLPTSAKSATANTDADIVTSHVVYWHLVTSFIKIKDSNGYIWENGKPQQHNCFPTAEAPPPPQWASQRHGRNPPDERSARRRDFYLTTHNIYKRQTSMPPRPVGFEPAIPTSERLQTHSFNYAVGSTQHHKYHNLICTK
jgi:hypothetical protein